MQKNYETIYIAIPCLITCIFLVCPRPTIQCGTTRGFKIYNFNNLHSQVSYPPLPLEGQQGELSPAGGGRGWLSIRPCSILEYELVLGG